MKLFLSVLFLAGGLAAQTPPVQLSLSGAAVAPGGTANLNLSIASVAGSEPAAVEFTLTFPAASVTSVTAAPGAAATAAGKVASCVGSSGKYRCMLVGPNKTTIANGVLATVAVTMAAVSGDTAIGVTNPLGATPAAAAIAAGATGATVSNSFDLNHDGKVDLQDLQLLLQQIMSGVLTSDLNGDGQFNVLDAQKMAASAF